MSSMDVLTLSSPQSPLALQILKKVTSRGGKCSRKTDETEKSCEK
jgi:hypothetical protein